MGSGVATLATPAALAAILAAVAWAPLTGFPTWPAWSRGRLGSTVMLSVVVGLSVLFVVRFFGAALAR